MYRYIDNVAMISDQQLVHEFVEQFQYLASQVSATVGDVEVGSTLTHRGVTINLKSRRVTLKQNFCQKLQRRLVMFTAKPTPDRIESLLGMMIYADSILPRGLGLMKPYLHTMRWLTALQRDQTVGARTVDCPTTVQAELTRWSNLITQLRPQSTATIPLPEKEVWVATDASKWGWGMVTNAHGRLTQFGRPWTNEERKLHINILEMLAAANAARYMENEGLLQQDEEVHLRWLVDNTTALAVVLNRGSRAVDLHRYAQEFLEICARNRCTLTSLYIQSAMNPADAPSRGQHLTLKAPTTLQAPVREPMMTRFGCGVSSFRK